MRGYDVAPSILSAFGCGSLLCAKIVLSSQKNIINDKLNTKYYVFRYCRRVCNRAQVGA